MALNYLELCCNVGDMYVAAAIHPNFGYLPSDTEINSPLLTFSRAGTLMID